MQILAVCLPAFLFAIRGDKVAIHAIEILFAQPFEANVKRIFHHRQRAAPCGGAGSPVDDWRRSYGLHLPAPSGSAVRLLSRLTAGGFQRWPADADPAGFDRMKNRGDEQALPVDTVRA